MTLEGPCDELTFVDRSGGDGTCVALRRCRQPGIERPAVAPDRAIAPIMCDEHYAAECARRNIDPGHPDEMIT